MEINDDTILQRILNYKKDISSSSDIHNNLSVFSNHKDPEVRKVIKKLQDEGYLERSQVGQKIDFLKKQLSKDFWNKSDYMWGDL